MLDGLKNLFELFRYWVLKLDARLVELSATLGNWLYVILFAVVFCETGLIVTPFLPGDSLLFAVGALVAIPETNLNLGLMFVLLTVAAVLGDAVNYSIGRMMGPKVFKSETSKLLNRKHLDKLRRSIRSTAARRFSCSLRSDRANLRAVCGGIGRMNYSRFWMFNVTVRLFGRPVPVCWLHDWELEADSGQLLTGHGRDHLRFVASDSV